MKLYYITQTSLMQKPSVLMLIQLGHRSCCVFEETKMANDLDRVRISAAELRAEASYSVNITDCGKGKRLWVVYLGI